MTEPEYGTLHEIWAVAEVIGRSKATVRDWWQRGELKHFGCDVATRRILVDLLEAQRYGEAHPPRAPRRRASQLEPGATV